jgi:1,5-anhydro-D-fructose reductase (1,5-anhydro-D-mannitol-forming)
MGRVAVTETVRWAFAGAGAHVQARVARALQAARNASGRGIWSRTGDSASRLAGRYDLPMVYRTFGELLADPQVDAVFIATPHFLHAEHAIAALSAGKHVLVEKPMAFTVGEAERMVAAAETAHRTLGVSFQLRHHILHEELVGRLAAGDEGTVLFASGSYSLFSFDPPAAPPPAWKRDPASTGGAGSLYGMGVHVLDLLNLVVGAPVTEVTAMTNAGAAQPIESVSLAILRYSSGALATMASSSAFPFGANDLVVQTATTRFIARSTINMPPAGELEITRRERRASSLPQAGLPGHMADLVRDRVLDREGSARTVIVRPLPDPFVRQFEAFGDAVTSGKPFRASGRDGLESVRVSAAVLESAQSGRTVPLAAAASGAREPR